MFAHVSLSFTQCETPLQEEYCNLIVAGPTQSRFTNLSEGNYKQNLKQINLSNAEILNNLIHQSRQSSIHTYGLAFLWHNLGNDSSFFDK
jgi:hypothetical protein